MRTKYKLPVWPFACFILAGGLSSCKKDFLDRNPTNALSSNTFWTTETDVQTALTGVYTRLQQNFLGYERVYLDGLTDNAYLDPGNTNQPRMTDLTTGSINAAFGSPLSNMYSSPYRLITSANYFLDNVDKAPVAEAKRNEYKGEVRFLRALAYFDLVQLFGGVPLYTKFHETIESAKIAKSSKEEVYAVIGQDLDFAIANLPDVKYNGHAVKGSAQALKARVLLTEQKWTEAAALCQQIMSSGKFALSNNYASLFRTSGQTNAAVNTEIMFSTQYLATTNPQRTSPGAGGMDIELGWYSLMQPYKDLADDYEMKDGKPAGESPLFNPADPYANRDPRLDQTMKLPNEVWKNSSGASWTGFTPTNTGFLMEKYVELSRAPFAQTTATATDQDYIHLRYADVLLMYAEAKNEAGGPDATVYKALNDVRARAGMPAVDQAKYDTKEKLREYIRHERRIELALEGQRYMDLKRWRIAHTKLPALKTPNNTSLVFLEKNYLLPFMQSELDANPQLRQNEGY